MPWLRTRRKALRRFWGSARRAGAGNKAEPITSPDPDGAEAGRKRGDEKGMHLRLTESHSMLNCEWAYEHPTYPYRDSPATGGRDRYHRRQAGPQFFSHPSGRKGTDAIAPDQGIGSGCRFLEGQGPSRAQTGSRQVGEEAARRIRPSL